MVRGFDAIGIVMAAVAGQAGNLAYLAIAWPRVASAAQRKPMVDAAAMKS